MNGEKLRLPVPWTAAGTRLDHFLAEQLPDRSRSALRRLIVDGLVLIDDSPAAKPGASLRAGSSVEVTFPADLPDQPQPEHIPFETIFEDDDLIVVDKPAGLVVHPGHGQRTGTLVNGLLGRGIALAAPGAPDRPGIVHRLDRGTSGVLVVAKSERAHTGLARAFEAREVKKHYIALVWGHPSPDKGLIERKIGRSRPHPIKMAVTNIRGRSREATSRYRTLESIPGFGFLEVFPRTGRTHQIRVHLQSIHHPIVGDELYGGKVWRGVQDPIKRKALREFERLALHAADLRFDHPVDGKPMTLHAPLPEDFAELLSILRRP